MNPPVSSGHRGGGSRETKGEKETGGGGMQKLTVKAATRQMLRWMCPIVDADWSRHSESCGAFCTTLRLSRSDQGQGGNQKQTNTSSRGS